MANTLKVGDKVFMVPTQKRRGSPDWVEITKIGRKWVSFGIRGRFDIETRLVDGGQYSSPAKIYLTEEEYIQEIELKKLWNEFYDQVYSWRSRPYWISKEKLESLLALISNPTRNLDASK